MAGIGFANTDRTRAANTAHGPGAEAPRWITLVRSSWDLGLVLRKQEGARRVSKHDPTARSWN